MKLKRKVLAYITKGEEEDRELLVFEHRDFPEAGLQVPGGTIERDELLIDALYREIEEESGIQRDELVLCGKLHKTNFFPKDKDEVLERNVFHFDYVGDHEREWDYKVHGDGKDEGLVFQFKWIPVEDLPKLASKQDQALEFIE